MERKLFPALFFLFPLAASAADLADVTACPGMDYGFKGTYYQEMPKFSNDPKPGEFHTACLDVPSIEDAQVCMAGKNGPLNIQEMTYTLTYAVPGKTPLTWNISGYEITDVRSFTVQETDLSGDGSKDIVVPVLTGGSNGFAISYYSIYVIADNGKKVLGPIDAEDYGTVSGLYRVPGRQGCILMLSKWGDNTGAGQSGGRYIRGRWYVLKGDAITEYTTLPAVERHFLDDFPDEFDVDDEFLPLLWFKDKSARPLKP